MIVSPCPYLAGCHPHHGAGFGPGAPAHTGGGVHLPHGAYSGLGVLMLLVLLGLIFDVAKKGWHG